MEPTPEAYLRLATKVQSTTLKVRLILQAFHARERLKAVGKSTPTSTGESTNHPTPATRTSDAQSFPAQQACLECGVHRAHAVRPLALRSNGWVCGYCVMRESIRHEDTVEPLHYITTTEERAAIAALPESNLTRQRLLPILLRQATAQDTAPPRAVFPGKTETRTSKEEALHAALSREPATARQLAETTSLPLGTVRDVLASLTAAGWVGHTGMGTKTDPFLYYKKK